MAEDKSKQVPSGTPSTDDKTNNGDALKQQLKDLTGGKFDSLEELAKAYKESQTKIGEQGEEVRSVREFMSVAEPVFEVLKKDEKLREAVEKKLVNQEDDSPKADAKDKAIDQDEVRDSTREMLRLQFETKHNFSKLPASEQSKLRAEIGKVINELTGTDFNRIDLRRLGPTLENAYTLAKSRITDKSTQEAIAEAEKDDGALSSMPSSGGKDVKTLSQEEATVAEKLGLTRDEYISGKK
jgi:hypothetical protein